MSVGRASRQCVCDAWRQADNVAAKSRQKSQFSGISLVLDRQARRCSCTGLIAPSLEIRAASLDKTSSGEIRATNEVHGESQWHEDYVTLHAY